jgi:RHS repeat-associated protein
MARTAPAPNIPPIPGMCPSIAVLAGGADSGGGSGGAAGSGGGNTGAGAETGGEDTGSDSRNAASGPPDYERYPECGYASHPVDVVSGRAFTHPVTDLELPGPLPLVFRRMYSAKMADRYVGLGFGWGHTFGWEVEVGRRTITVWNEQGVAVEFPMIAPGGEIVGPWGWVLRRESWGFALDADDGLWHLFSTSPDGRRHRLTAIEDRNKNRIALTYEDDRLVEIKDSVGRIVRVRSSREGRIGSLEVLNAPALGRWVPFARYEHDERGDLVCATDADGFSCRFAYDDEHHLVEDVDRAGLAFHFVYDDKGRCVESWGDYPGRRDASLDDELPKLLADGVTRAKGVHHCRFAFFDDGYSEVADSTQVRRFFGNEHGLLDKRVEGGAVTTAAYDKRGHLLGITDAMGATTRFERDARGRILTRTDPLGRVTRVERDALGLPVRETNAMGGVTVWERDRFGNVRLLRDAAGGITSFSYDERGLPVEIVDANGEKTAIAYDEQANVVAVTQPNGAVWRYGYDAFGRRTSMTDPLGVTRRYVYSERGDLLAEHDGLGGARRYGWDGEGHLLTEDAPSGQRTEYAWGGYHRLVTKKAPNGDVVTLRYNYEGELVRVVNGRGDEHRLTYDTSGKLVGEKTFDGRTLRYTNDAMGRAVRVVNGAGERTELVYGPLGELVAKIYDDDSKDTFEYDDLGNLVAATGKVGTFRFERDPLGRIVREKQEVGGEEHVVELAYDPLGQRRERRTSLGHVERIERDSIGSRTRTVLDGGFEILHASDAVGRELERRLPGGGRIASLFDAEGRLGRRRALSPVASRPVAPGEPDWLGTREEGVTVDKTYRYDFDGELVEASDAQRGATEYRYDPVGQLVAMVPAKARATLFRFDAAGNVYEADREASRRYDRGRLVEKGNATYRWDEDGRLVEKRAYDEAERTELVTSYAWDAVGQLAKVSLPSGEIVELTYDPFARRVQKRVSRPAAPGERAVPVSLTRFVWDGERLVHEIKRVAQKGGDPVVEERTYCFEDESHEPLAQRDRRHASAEWLSYLNDPAGAPDRLVASDGQVACELEREAWGGARVASGAKATTPLRLLGQYHDDETGLAYNRFRYYDADTGRFVSPDPMGLEGGSHPYVYAPNTQSWVDPLGLRPLKPVVLGETMKTRVSPVGEAMGAHTFSPRSRFTPSVDGQDACNKAWEKNQRRWMRDQIRSGREIYDIGQDPARANRSEYCRMEHEELIKAGYKRECAGTVDATVEGKKQTFPLYRWVKK